MAQPVEAAREAVDAGGAGRNRPKAACPARRGAGIDVRAQCVVARPVAVHALQVRARGAALGAQRGQDGVAAHRAVAAQPRLVTAGGGQVDGRVDQVVRRVARRHRALPVVQRQPGGARGVELRLHGQAAARRQREHVGGPGDGRAHGQRVASGGLHRDRAAGQARLYLARVHGGARRRGGEGVACPCTAAGGGGGHRHIEGMGMGAGQECGQRGQGGKAGDVHARVTLILIAACACSVWVRARFNAEMKTSRAGRSTSTPARAYS